jgi:hypothetical protein
VRGEEENSIKVNIAIHDLRMDEVVKGDNGTNDEGDDGSHSVWTRLRIIKMRIGVA